MKQGIPVPVEDVKVHVRKGSGKAGPADPAIASSIAQLLAKAGIAGVFTAVTGGLDPHPEKYPEGITPRYHQSKRQVFGVKLLNDKAHLVAFPCTLSVGSQYGSATDIFKRLQRAAHKKESAPRVAVAA